MAVARDEQAIGLPFELIAAATGRNLPISSERVRKFALAEVKLEADKVRATGFGPQRRSRMGFGEWSNGILAKGKDQ
jgi:GlcNAc-P-P-Und epimerase